jgi:GDP-L-fucose synthase
MFKDSKIYVAGHTGLLGTALLKELRTQGYINIVTRGHAELDLTSHEAVDEFFRCEQPEYVFMAAGLTGGIIANKTYPASFLHTNISMQDSVFEAACKYDVRQLIFYGSSCIYPKNSPQPMKEEFLLTGAMEDTSEAYAIAKLAGIIACKSYNTQFGTKRFIALIPNSMYGPNDNFDPESSHVIPALIRKFTTQSLGAWEVACGAAEIQGGVHFSEDVVMSLFCHAECDKFQNTHYNIGTGVITR